MRNEPAPGRGPGVISWRAPAIKPVTIGLRSRVLLFLLIRCLLKPLIWLTARRPTVRSMLKTQLRLAWPLPERSHGLPVDYRIVGGVPGPVAGDFADTGRMVLLYLHGGGFILPAAAHAHLKFFTRLCGMVDATGFLPDYRLAPLHPYPAALDDCERAYRGLLDAGFAPGRIALAGESAGGNLVLGLLQRIRRQGLPMPACAVPISPVTEMARGYAPPSRVANRGRDPMFPGGPLGELLKHYTGAADGADPELSPLYADYRGFPPLFFLAGESELLRDDSVLAARAAEQAGVPVRLDLWPVLPHAFPLFANLFPEARQSHEDIAAFIRQHASMAPARAGLQRLASVAGAGPLPAKAGASPG